MTETPTNKYQKLLPHWNAAGERDDIPIDVYDVHECDLRSINMPVK